MQIQVKNFNIQIPDQYQKVDSMPEDPAESVAYGYETSHMMGFMLFFPISKEDAMPFDSVQEVIDGVHHQLSDDQGLIEAEAGKTKNGNRFVYSIVKTKQEIPGIQYTLTLHAEYPEHVLHVQAFFDEAGVTGQRDSLIFGWARHNNLVNENMVGWWNDPYTPDFRKGFLMNISEEKRFDSRFPGYPLTELRNFIDFFISNN